MKIKGTSVLTHIYRPGTPRLTEQQYLVVFTVGQVLDFMYATQNADFSFQAVTYPTVNLKNKYSMAERLLRGLELLL